MYHQRFPVITLRWSRSLTESCCKKNNTVRISVVSMQGKRHGPSKKWWLPRRNVPFSTTLLLLWIQKEFLNDLPEQFSIEVVSEIKALAPQYSDPSLVNIEEPKGVARRNSTRAQPPVLVGLWRFSLIGFLFVVFTLIHVAFWDGFPLFWYHRGYSRVFEIAGKLHHETSDRNLFLKSTVQSVRISLTNIWRVYLAAVLLFRSVWFELVELSFHTLQIQR